MGAANAGFLVSKSVRTRYRSFCLLLIGVGMMWGSSGCVSYGNVTPDAEPVRANGKLVSMPANAPSISQGFNPRIPGAQRQEARAQHNGIDIRAEHGTPVIAPASGRVSDAYFSVMYGRCLTIDHGNDAQGRPLASHYFHLAERTVDIGQYVMRGQQIGSVGMSGLLAGFPHLHYEIRRGTDTWLSQPLNPHLFWQAGVGVVTCYDKTVHFPDTPFATTFPVPCRGVSWR